MAILGFELEEITRLMQMLEESGLDEIVFREESRYLRVRGPHKFSGSDSAQNTQAEAPPQMQRALPPVSPAAAAIPEDQIALASPMMGMFYRSEKPGGPPLVTVGQSISVGQAIGIIEAMKIFSEVLAEYAGIVVAVPAVDGELVQAGEPLIILKK